MKRPTLPASVLAEIRAEAKRRLVVEFRRRGDLFGVELLLGRQLPEIERWAIVSNRFNP